MEYGVRHSYQTILNFLPRIKLFSIFSIDCLKTPSSMSIFSTLFTARLITAGSRLKRLAWISGEHWTMSGAKRSIPCLGGKIEMNKGITSTPIAS